MKKIVYVSLIFVFSAFFINSVVPVKSTNGQSDEVEGTVRVAVCGNNQKEPLEQCDGPDLGANTCQTLGFDGGTLLCMPSCQFLTSSCLTSSEAAEEAVFSKESGGSLEIENPEGTELIVEVPVSAFSTDLSLFAFSHLSSDVSSQRPAPSGKSFIGNVYDLRFFDENGSRIKTLLKPAELSVSYLEADISQGYAESKIEPYHFNEEDSSWHLIPGFTLDQGENTVEFETTSFSFFALFSSPPDPDSPPPPPSSGGTSGGGFLNFLPPSFPFLPFLQTPYTPPTPAMSPDFNGDNKVDISDLSILLYWWGKTGPEIAIYDLNGDGIIDIVDASILFYHWTK